MESINASVSSLLFLENFVELKKKLTFPLPSDLILYQCANCNTNLPFNVNGVIKISRALDKNVGCTIEEMIKEFYDNHAKGNNKCSNKICIHPVGTPNNILVSYPESDQMYIKEFTIGIDAYQVRLLITAENTKSIFALYQKEQFHGQEYSEFLECNFNTFLNVKPDDKDNFFEEYIVDDESLNNNQHYLPRLTGGGRALNADYNYQCQWCPEDVIKMGQKGRFRELKSYRKHFKTHHHSEDGNGVSMAEFNERVKRSEPTWFCERCEKYLSLGNSVRHKAICHTETSSSESSDEEERQKKRSTSKENKKQNYQNKNKIKKHKLIYKPPIRDSESESSNAEGISDRVDSRVDHKKEKPKKKMCIYDYPSSDDDQAATSKNTVPNRDENLTKKKQRTENVSLHKDSSDPCDMNRRTSQIMAAENIAVSKRNNDDESFSSSDEQQHHNYSQSNKNKKIKQVNVDYSFLEVGDEIECSLIDDNVVNSLIEPKPEPENEFEIDIDIQSSSSNAHKFNQWWKKVPLHLYGDRSLGGPKIFLPDDKEDFVKRCIEKYKTHIMEKKLLDKRMQEAESEEAKLLQFSETRDKPILNRYTEFVQNYSAKDVLHIFSEEYEQLNLPIGSKSSTATQYSSRIIEFFKFMAGCYNNFHLDWMVDFKGEIEKTYKDGNKSKDIFLPTKEDLTQFIKKFKYGSNPAANCGLRIFAIKKLLEFLKQEIKDHEHVFEGTILEKANIVSSLLKTIDNLNETVVPAGTIKHLSTASNKSHKKALLEQMARCPQRSLTSIMSGVQEYVNSEEFNHQKTLLIELACKKMKIPTEKEYMNSTNWLLEQLVCLGGNRPCALLGITIRDWEDRKAGYCPFFQDEENETAEDDPVNDRRKILRDPYKKPKGSDIKEPTGVIVQSETDKIAVGQPCYIWFPNALVELVNIHSLMAQKILPRSVDIYHPTARLFLNSKGKEITKIECKHFKEFIGLPITAYDFRRSLSTFCLDSKVEAIKRAEPSILRHREETGYAYYYQKHGEKVEYVSIQYAMKHGLIKAETEYVDNYCITLQDKAKDEELKLAEKRTEMALEFSKEVINRRKQSLNDARQKGGRNWILPHEYEAFIEGIEEAILIEERKKKAGQKAGPFSNLLNYKPGQEGAGTFPPNEIWQLDMFRVLYGLTGQKGDAMRKVELSVYDGVPFSEGQCGRKKIATALEQESTKKTKSTNSADEIVARYWRDKIRAEARQLFAGKWLPLRFIFTEKELAYNQKILENKIKTEK